MKTQKLLYPVMLLITLSIFSACEKLDYGAGITGQGPMIEKQYHVNKFDKIEIDVDADVFISRSQQDAVSIEGQNNILNNLSVVMEYETLKIRYTEPVCTHERLQIHISMPVLQQVSTIRSAKIKSENSFSAEKLTVQVYGSGVIDLSIEHAGEVHSELLGSGQIKLEGSAEKHHVTIKGSGSVISRDLITGHSNVHITGNGKCEVHSGKELNVQINGNGMVFYTGNPGTLHTNLTGNGKLKQIE